METLEKWTRKKSGWDIDGVQTLWLDIARYQPLRGGSYIPLPAAVAAKNKGGMAVLNVKNKDDSCLRWALRSALANPAPPHHPERTTWYSNEVGLDFTGIDAPTPVSQIPKVERQNNLAINVFGWEKGVIIHHISKQPGEMPRINLLLIEKSNKFHYTWIKDVNRLLHDQSKYKELRKVANSDFEKDLYKLMNNNLRKRVNVKLVRAHEEDKLRHLIASPAFARANIFDDDLAAIQMHKSCIVLYHPMFVGMSILDLSKHLM